MSVSGSRNYYYGKFSGPRNWQKSQKNKNWENCGSQTLLPVIHLSGNSLQRQPIMPKRRPECVPTISNFVCCPSFQTQMINICIVNKYGCTHTHTDTQYNMLYILYMYVSLFLIFNIFSVLQCQTKSSVKIQIARVVWLGLEGGVESNWLLANL